MNSEFYYLGTLTRLTGLKGELCAFFDADNSAKYTNLPAVFIDIDGDYVPYPIESIRYKGGNQFVIKLEGVDLEEAKSLCGSELYLPLDELPPLTGTQFYFHEVIGFQVVDEEKGNIGTCRDILELAQNPLMQVVNPDGKEILIPVNQQFIRKVDRESKVLYIAAPEGLIDLYLS